MTEDLLNPEASERHLIGALGTGAYRLGPVFDTLPGDDFYKRSWGAVWDAARGLYTTGTGIDPISLSRHMAANGQLNEAAKEVLRNDLLGGVSMGSADHHAQVVAEWAAARRLFVVARQTAADALAVADGRVLGEVVARAHTRLADLDDATALDEMPKSWGQVLGEWNAVMAEDAVHPPIYPTPWDNFNEVTGGGLQGGRFYLFGGRPGDGKSTASFNLAGYFSEQHIPTLFISAEMSDLEVTSRVVARGAEVDLRELVNYQPSQGTRRRFADWTANAADHTLWIDDRQTTLPRIKSMARTLKRRHGLAVLVVDYLQIVRSGDRFSSRQEEVAHISRELKALARELNIAVVAPVQLNRGPAARADARPLITDLRESGQLEQDADMVVLLHHPTQEDPHDPTKTIRTGDIEFIIAKHRHGQTCTVSLSWYGSYATISNPRR